MLDKIKNWGIWKTFFVFNIISAILFLPLLVLVSKLSSGHIDFIYLKIPYFWIPVIFPIISLFIILIHSSKKFKDKSKGIKEPKLNKVGKILFFTIITIVLVSYISLVLYSESTTCSECGWGYAMIFIFGSIILSPILLTGAILWTKSNMGWKNTVKLTGLFILSVLFQLVPFLILYLIEKLGLLII